MDAGILVAEAWIPEILDSRKPGFQKPVSERLSAGKPILRQVILSRFGIGSPDFRVWLGC